MVRRFQRAKALIAWVLLLGLLSACGAQATPWVESFDTADAWQFSSDPAADVSVTDGHLQIHILQPEQIAWASAGQNWRDFHLTVEATPLSGPDDNEYGVLVRMKDDANFYAFSVSGDGYVRVARYESGQWTLLGPDWTHNEAVHTGTETNRLEITTQGAQMTFAVNGVTVAQVTDGSLSHGDIGLYAGAFSEADVVVAFDSLTIEPR